MRSVLMFLLCHSRTIFAIVLLAVGGYLVYDALQGKKSLEDMKSWLENNGDSELKGYYTGLNDSKQRQALGVVFKTYQHRYGKGAWVEKFREDNPVAHSITYMDLAEIAIGISTAENREKFIEAHAKTYDACIRQGYFNEAKHYVEVLRKLRDIGGRSWRVAAENSFALCVYDAVQSSSSLLASGKSDLWSWYLDNYQWCDSFLATCNPEEGAKLDEVLVFARDHNELLKRFDEEISALSKDEMSELADGDDEAETKEALYASCLSFVGSYSLVLETMCHANSAIPMLEAMAVLANNFDALDLSAPNACRKSAMELVAIYDHKRLLWDSAADDFGAGALKLNKAVPQWCEQLVGEYGRMNVVGFLSKYYDESPALLRVAAEILYRCHDPGWVVLQKYRDNDQFKMLMANPKIGFRIVPYYLRQGDKVFSELREDPRWIDEVLDKNGDLKRQDVSWYEVSDIATVVKKMAQNRPITSAEWGWAAFEAVDLAAMAFTGGASKAVTTAGKSGVKSGAKAIGRKATKQLTVNGMRRLECKMVVRKGIGAIAKGGTRKNLSLLKRTTKMFKGIAKTAKTGADAIGNGLRRVRNMSPAAKKSVYRSAKTLLYIKFFTHTVPDKGSDWVAGAEEKIGETIGKHINAIVAGAGEGFKKALKESFGGSKPDSLVMKILGVTAGCVLLVFGLKIILPKK